MLLLLAASVPLLAVVGLILYARWNYGTLEKMGLQVDKPHFILGNTHDIFTKSGGLYDIDNFKKFGPVYGVYEGRHPQVHICEPELIRLITSKDSEYFNGKRLLDFRNKILNEMPDFQAYDKWKAIRSILTPVFSSAKLKIMANAMGETLEDFTKDIKDQVESTPGKRLVKSDVRSEIFDMVTDLIARCCFGVKIDNPSDPNNMFSNIVRGLLAPENTPNTTLETWTYSFPFLQKISPAMFDIQKVKDFQDILKHMMATRKQSGLKKGDVIDLCLDLMEKTKTSEYKRIGITEDTVICQAFVFFFAGQDQISSVTACMINQILKNPEVEKRLYAEVDAFLKKHNGRIEYDNIGELQYLLACINESLRLNPFFTRTERVCTKDWENKEYNLKIKKGITVQIPIWATNRNPKYFEDPERYDPERFLSPNKEKMHPYAFTSFGYGPRNCIGMRFSLDTMVLISTHLIKNFKFHLRPDSEPVYIPAGPFFGPHLPFYFDVTLRN